MARNIHEFIPPGLTSKRICVKLLEVQDTLPTDECIDEGWPFKYKDGRPHIKVGGSTKAAARYICMLRSGDVPGKHAAHTCHNRRCVNPHHIEWQTPLLNNSTTPVLVVSGIEEVPMLGTDLHTLRNVLTDIEDHVRLSDDEIKVVTRLRNALHNALGGE